MFKTRHRKLVEQAKKEPNYRSDKELEIDESSLQEEDKPHFELPLGSLILFGVILLLMIGCIIAIVLLRR